MYFRSFGSPYISAEALAITTAKSVTFFYDGCIIEDLLYPAAPAFSFVPLRRNKLQFFQPNHYVPACSSTNKRRLSSHKVAFKMSEVHLWV